MKCWPLTINRCLNNVLFQKTIFCIFILAIFASYWLFSRHYKGPAYLSDEIGYLTKAAAFAGYPVDMASSWHGGYSLMLSPLFALSNDPFAVWQGVMVLNAAMWAFSFMLLYYFLRHIFPRHGFWTVFFAVAVSATYPSWISMSGYAFSTSGFVLVYMLSLFALIKVSENNALTIIPYSVLIGYLYWIHPTGCAVVAASLPVAAGFSWHTRRASFFLLHSLIAAAMIMAYRSGIHGWLNQIMTPESHHAWDHYGDVSTLLKRCLLNESFWFQWPVAAMGHSSAVIISTFGIAAFAFAESSKRICSFRERVQGPGNNMVTDAVLIFMTLSILAVILIGSFVVEFGLIYGRKQDLDLWIQGRYSDHVLLPLFAAGLLVPWKGRHALIACVFLFVTGLLLHVFTFEPNTVSHVNEVNMQGFWPQSVFSHAGFLIWFVLGMAGIILATALKKRFFVFLVVPVFFLSVMSQSTWHKGILSHYSRPAGVVDFVRANFPGGTTIGFNPGQPPAGTMPERRNLYSYYFFNYDFRRMPPEEWMNGYNGPYLTYTVDEIGDSDEAKIIGREMYSGLFVALKKDEMEKISAVSLISRYGLYRDDTEDGRCLVAGCFRVHGGELTKFSQVGVLLDGEMTSNGQSGFLFYGPYVNLKKGHYYLQMEGSYENPSGAVLDVVSQVAKKKHLEIVLADVVDIDETTVLPFSIPSDADNLEVRLKVSEDTRLRIRGYEIKTRDGE